MGFPKDEPKGTDTVEVNAGGPEELSGYTLGSGMDTKSSNNTHILSPQEGSREAYGGFDDYAGDHYGEGTTNF